jgi:hypothetical protein
MIQHERTPRMGLHNANVSRKMPSLIAADRRVPYPTVGISCVPSLLRVLISLLFQKYQPRVPHAASDNQLSGPCPPLAGQHTG